MISDPPTATFGAFPGRYLILDHELMIVAASDAYLDATGAEREQIVGRRVFEILPNSPDAVDASAVADTVASLNRVLSLKRPDGSPQSQQEAPLGIASAVEANGSMAHRYLLPMNTPVLDDAGEVRWIIHSAEDVTALVPRGYREPAPTRLEARRVLLDRLRAAHGVLSALPDPFYEVLRDHLVPVELQADQDILEQQQLGSRVYFSFSGLYAFIRHLQDGSSIQVALAGNDCMFGLAPLFGNMGNVLAVRTLVRGWALSVRTSILAGILNAHPEVRLQLGQRTLGLMTQISQTAACNARHSVDQRVALWLLLAADCLGTLELHVTQESIAMLLGSRRAGVSEALGRLSQAGLVATGRQAITVTDRPRLQRWACSCYEESLGWGAAQPSRRVSITPEFTASLPSLMKSCATGAPG